ncbi:XkdW family protein [Brevibacillus laterosporus]
MPIVTLGQEIAKTKIELSQKDALIQSLGEELADLRLDIIQLKGGGQ